MAEEDSVYLRDIPLNAGPFDPAVDTVIGTKRNVDGIDEDVRIPLRFFDTGRNRVVNLNIASGAIHVDYRYNDYFKLNMTSDVLTWSFEGMPIEDTAATLAIYIEQGATPRNMVWPPSFLWVGSAPLPSMLPNAIDLLVLTTFDSGTTWLADLARDYRPTP